MQETKNESVSELLCNVCNSLKDLTDVNVIVGDKIIYENICIIPISKVKCAFVSGGINQKKTKDERNPFGGASGGTFSISPVAFLAFVDGDVKVLHLDDSTHTIEKMIDFIPTTIQTILKNTSKAKI